MPHHASPQQHSTSRLGFFAGFLLGVLVTAGLSAALYFTVLPSPEGMNAVASGEEKGTLESALAALESGDYEQAHAQLMPLAESGDATAMTALGRMYEQGQGVARSHPMAYQWYQPAAEAGASQAQRALARLYAYGYGVDQDLSRAAKWSSRANATDEVESGDDE